MNSAIITITSDWGSNSFYEAIVSGIILSEIPDCRIISTTDNIRMYNLMDAAFVVKNIWHNFPKGSVHIIAINSAEKDPIAIQYEGHYFIGANNGIFGLILNHPPEKANFIDTQIEKSIFPERDYFAKAATHLAAGKAIENLGKPLYKIETLNIQKPFINENTINGCIIYTDCYKNAISNISEELFNKATQGKKFTIRVGSERSNKISTHYTDVKEGEMVTLFGNSHMLEIAINKGEAKNLLNLSVGKGVNIEIE